jgi:hypothetical protein
MAKLTLAEMRAKFAEQESKKGKYENGGDNAGYPFWDIPDNATATIRFLPDGDNNNEYFWVERAVIKLPFPGVKGGDTNKPITVQVPSMHTWKKTCPITEEIKPWWKGTEDEQALARTYYRKLSYLYQGFVVQSPLKEENTPENPIRRLIINKSIHEKIKAGLMDPDMPDMPTDFANGFDFRLTKTKQGKYANYDTSSFARKSRGLTEEESAAVEAHGLFNLKDYLPKEPDEKTLALIMEMFEASVGNELFDAERFKAFRHSGGQTASAQTSAKTETAETPDEAEEVAPAAKPAAAPKVNKLKEEEATGDKPKKSPQDVLKMLRERKAAGEAK